jgi:hypothetical protein
VPNPWIEASPEQAYPALPQKSAPAGGMMERGRSQIMEEREILARNDDRAKVCFFLPLFFFPQLLTVFLFFLLRHAIGIGAACKRTFACPGPRSGAGIRFPASRATQGAIRQQVGRG